MNFISPGKQNCFRILDNSPGISMEHSGRNEELLAGLLNTIETATNSAQIECCMCELAEFLEDFHVKDVNDLESSDIHCVVLKAMDDNLSNSTVHKQGLFVLSRLVELSEYFKSELQCQDEHPFILHVIGNFAQDVCIQALGCKLMADLVESQTIKEDLVDGGAVSIIFEAVKTFTPEEELQIYALRALFKLLENDPLQQQKFVSRGGFSGVADVVKFHVNSGEIQEEAFKLLCEVMMSVQACDNMMYSKSFVVVLNSMRLHYDLPELQISGCQMLLEMSKSDMNQEILNKHCADEVVLVALRQHRKNALVQRYGMQTMVQLMKHMQLTDIRCCGFLQDVFYAMATLGDDPAVVKVCHQCLRQLSARCPLLDIGMEEGIDRVDKMPIHLIMVPLMLHPDNVELCLEACQTVVAVSSDCETMQKALMSKGITLAILQAMERHSHVASMQQWGFSAIRNLCISSYEYKHTAIMDGVLDAIDRAVCSFPSTADVQEEMIGLIACLATDVKLVRHQCAAQQIHQRIITAMKEFDTCVSLLEMCLEALGVLAEAEELQGLIVESGGVDAILQSMAQHLDEPDVQQKACMIIQVLAPLLSDEQCHAAMRAVINAMCMFEYNEGVQEEGGVAMSVIVQSDQQKGRILVNLCAHERLFRMLERHADNPSLTSIASECLLYLGKHCNLKADMLLSACALGMLRGAEFLVEMGADVNSGHETKTPLCTACKNSREEVVRFLLRQGISDVQTALRLCLEMGHDTLVGILLQHIGHEREAGIVTWSRLNLGELKPEWIAPTLSGKRYSPTRTGRSSRWLDFLEDAEYSMKKRATISECLNDTDASPWTTPKSSQAGGPARASIGEERSSELDLTDGELTEVSPLRARSRSGASFPYSLLDPRVVSGDRNAVIVPRSASRSFSDSVLPVLQRMRCNSVSCEHDVAFCESPESTPERPDIRRRRTTTCLNRSVCQMPGARSFFYSPGSKVSRSRSVTVTTMPTELNTSKSDPLRRKTLTRKTMKVNPKATIRLFDASANGIKDLEPIASAGEQLLTHFTNVERLDLGQNKLASLPVDFCKAMPKLQRVNLSRNELESFPLCLINNERLEEVNLSHNKISAPSHPAPDMTTMSVSVTKLDLSHNALTELPKWLSNLFPALARLNLASNNITKLSCSPLELCCLKTLNLSRNKIKEIPKLFLRECHNLEELNVTDNSLRTLPESLAPFLAKLKILRAAGNKLAKEASPFVPRFILALWNLRVVDLARNELVQLPPPKAWSAEHIKELDVAENKIKKWTLEEGVGKWASLERLDLRGNNLKRVPKGIGRLAELKALDLSANPLTYLPDEMGNLSKLWDLQLSGLNLGLDASLVEGNKKELIDFLRHKLQNSVPYYRMKVMLVGLPGRGKTTLLCRLQGGKFRDGHADVDVRDWVMKDCKATCKNCHRKGVRYTISAWEIKGQPDQHTGLQCLLSARTLYLLIYDVSRGTQEIEELRPWLLSLQACAPDASVMLVGTHSDRVAKERKAALLQDITDNALRMCSAPGFPQVKSHVVMNCTEEDSGVKALRCKIVELMVKCKCKGRALIGVHVPPSYTQLQDLLERKARALSLAGGVPILRRAEVRRLVQENELPMEPDEMDKAVKFLHEAGVLVHYDDPGSRDLYFTDPKWLYHVISRVAASKALVTNCTMDTGALGRVLALPEEFTQQVLRLLQRYDVALPVNSKRWLVPSRLGPRPSSICRTIADPASLVRRVYAMTYVPMGFWAKLIARLLTFAPTMCANPSTVEEKQCWRDGMAVMWSAEAFFVVSSGREPHQVEVAAPYNPIGCQLFCYVVDHVDSLVEEWFPELRPLGDQALIKKLVPCVTCVDDSSHAFSLEECITLSDVDEFITCPKTSVRMPLQQVAPDVVMGDKRWLIEQRDLALVESRDFLLGDGGFGAVYRAKCRGKAVAVKLFHAAQDSGNPHRMLRQELKFLSRLRHPSVISLVGVSVKPRALVLELAPLCSLSALFNSQGGLGRGIQHRIAMQVAEGLAYLHFHRIVYRDLKPHNVLIFSLSLGILVNAKIADFGIARYAAPYGLVAVEGTAGYRAPEVAREHVAYGEQADMYSLGMLLYELVTGGRRPFEELKFRCELDAAVLQGRALDPITAEGCPPWPDMADLIEQLLEAEPDKRPTADQAYERLCSAELVSLKREVAVCKGQTVACMTTVRYHTKNAQHRMEVWMGSGSDDVSGGQVSWADVTDSGSEGCRGTMLKDRSVTSIAAVQEDLVLVGTKSGKIYAFDARSHSCVDESLGAFCTLAGAVNTLHPLPESDMVFAGSASGQLVRLGVKVVRAQRKFQPIHVELDGGQPVVCLASTARRLYCGLGNEVVRFSVCGDQLDIDQRWSVRRGEQSRGLVQSIAVGAHVWTSTQDSACVDVWDPNYGELIETVDCGAILVASGVQENAPDMRVLSLLLLPRELWVGLGSGHVILFNRANREPVSIIKRHASAVRCMAAADCGLDSDKPISLVVTGGMGFVERPGCEWKKADCKFGYALMWEAGISGQAEFLKTYRSKRRELAVGKRKSSHERGRKMTEQAAARHRATVARSQSVKTRKIATVFRSQSVRRPENLTNQLEIELSYVPV